MIEVTWTSPTGPYILEARQRSGSCNSEYSQFEVMQIEPASIMILGPNEVCPDNDIPVYYSTSFAGGQDYEWTIAPPHIGSIIEGQGSNEVGIKWHYVDEPTNVTLSVSSDICGSMQSSQISLVVTPFDGSIIGPDEICADDPALFELDGTASAYVWYVNDVEVGNSPSLNYSFSLPGTHMVRLEIMDGNGCNGEAVIFHTIDVLENPRPQIFVSEALPCPVGSPFNVDLVATQFPGLTVSYQWQKEGVDIPGATMSTLSNVTMTGQYTVIVDHEGCTNSRTIALDYSCDESCPCDPEVVVDIINIELLTNDRCGEIFVEGNIDEFGDTRIVGKRWLRPNPNGGGFISLEFDDLPDLFQTWTYNEPGLYTLFLQVDWECPGGDICTVTDAATIEIPVIADLMAEFSCLGNGDAYNILIEDRSRSVVAGLTTAWTVDGMPQGGGSSLNLVKNQGSSVEVCIRKTTTTSYSCEYCEVINVPVTPTAEFTLDQSGFCEGQLVTLTPIISDLSDIADITWDFGDGSLSRLMEPEKAYTQAGNSYDIQLDITTVYGCLVSDVTQIEVAENNLEGEVTVDLLDCESTASLSYVPTSGSTIVSYEWFPGGENMPSIVVSQNNMYSVEVTDDNGCSFSTQPVSVELNSPFTGDIRGSLTGCGRIRLSITASGTFTYTWTVSGPNGYMHEQEGNSINLTGLESGMYDIEVTASDNGSDCSSLMTTVEVFAIPDEPVLEQEVVTCQPFSARLFADQPVNWSGGGINPPIFSDELFVSSEGTYFASVTNDDGCTNSSNIFVDGLIDLSFIQPDCQEACLEDIINGEISISGIPGDFEVWKWLVDGSDVSGGSGSITPLVIIEDYLDKPITLYVANESCEVESEAFFIEGENCGGCETIQMEGLVNYSLCVVGADFDNLVLTVGGSISLQDLPGGFSDCGYDPIFRDVITNDDVLDWIHLPHVVSFEGTIIILDKDKFFEEGGIWADWVVCDENGNECPVEIFFPFQMGTLWMCQEGQGLMCPNIQVCSEYKWKIENTVENKICINLPFINSGECTISEYSISLTTVQNGELVEEIYSGTVTSNTQPDIVQWCHKIILPLEVVEKLDGILIKIQNNCGQECELLYPINEAPYNYRACFINLAYDGKGDGGNNSGGEGFKIPDVGFTISPNPSNGDIVVQFDHEFKEGILEVLDMYGVIQKQFKISEFQESISLDLRNLKVDTYILRLSTNEHVVSKIFTIQK